MTIANMGAELGLTTSVFPSDDVTRSFLTRLGRGDDWRPAAPDDDATYDDEITLDLAALTPLVALPGSPDRVVPVEEVAGTAVEQVMVGSCTNGSWHDMASVADIVRGRRASRRRPWDSSSPTAPARSRAGRTSSRCRWASRWPRPSRRRS